MTQGVGIIFKGAMFNPQAGYFRPPVPRGLVAQFMLGGSLEKSAINGAEGFPDAIVNGVPIVSPYYLSFKSKVNFLRTQRRLPKQFSYVIIGRSTDTQVDAAHQGIFAGTSGESAGGNLYQTASNLTFNSYQAGVSEPSTLAATPASWKMVVASADENSQGIWNLTTGTAFTEPQVPIGDLDPSTLFPGIGSGGGPSSGFGGTVDMAYACIHEVFLSADERATYINRMRPWGNSRDIPI